MTSTARQPIGFPFVPDTTKARAVVLVHGIFDTSRIFARMAHRLKERGFRTLAPDLAPSSGSSGLDQLAEQLQRFIESNLAAEERFDIVGFSMGGLIGRYYVQRLGGSQRVGHLITISAPHHGTLVAYSLGSRGAKQMRPGSAFLQDLNRDATSLRQTKFASLWTPFDLMIVPAHSSRLGIGEEIKFHVLLHPWMLRDERCLGTVMRLLSA